MAFANKAAFVITSSTTKLPSTLTNKVVLVSLTDDSLKTVANGGQIHNLVTFNGKTVPADAVFKLASDLSGAAMSYDVLFYDGATGTIIANVLKASCALGDTFYLGIGDGSVASYQGGSVGAAYPSTYKLAWYPGDGSSLNLLDSTSNSQNGSNSGVTATAGKIKAAGRCDGSSTIDFGVLPDIAQWTIRLWAKTSVGTSQYVLGRCNSSANYAPFWMQVNGLSGYTAATSDWRTVTDGTASTGAWHRLGFRFDGSTLSTFVDGVKTHTQASAAATVTSATLHLILAQCGDYSGGGKFNGDIDGFEILDSALTDDEMTADFYSQNDPSASGFFSSITITSSGPTGTAAAAATATAVGSSSAAAVGSSSSTSTAIGYTSGIFKYVEPVSGNDANDGSLGAPWKTIAYAALNIPVGGTIVLRGGSYREAFTITYGTHPTGTSWSNAITIEAYSGEEVIWSAPGYGDDTAILGFASDSTPDRAMYWIIDGISFRGDGSLDGVRTLGYCMVGAANYVRLRNVELSYSRRSGMIGGSYWEFLNCHVHDCGDGSVITPDHGIYWTGKGLLVDGGNWYRNSCFGIHIFHQGGVDTDDNEVRGAYVYDNGFGTHTGNSIGGGGILISTGHRGFVYNCLVLYNRLGIGIQIDYRQDGAQIYSNTCYGNDSSGIAIRDGGGSGTAVNTVVKNNICFGNGSTQIADNASNTTATANLITDPLFVDVGSVDFRVQSASDARGYGVDLHSVGLATLNFDLLGNPRPNGAWTAGAIEYTENVSVASASSTSTATAVGAAMSRAVGSAAASSTAVAIAGASYGTAASTSTATAVGRQLYQFIGSAAALSTVTGFGISTARSVGSSSSTSTAHAGTPPSSISQAILDKVLKNIEFSSAPVWISLHSGPPGLTGEHEISGGDYHRASAGVTSWIPGDARLTFNQLDIQFPEMPVCTISWAGIWDSENGGVLIQTVPLDYPITLKEGNTPKFEGGHLFVKFSTAFSTYLSNAILNYLFLGTNFTTAPVYWSLHTGVSEVFGENAGAASTEVVGGSYARQIATIADWSLAGESLNGDSLFSLDYDAVVTFAGMPTVSIKRLALWDAATDGNFLMWGPELSLDVTSGQTVTIDGTVARTLSATLTQSP